MCGGASRGRADTAPRVARVLDQIDEAAAAAARRPLGDAAYSYDRLRRIYDITGGASAVPWISAFSGSRFARGESVKGCRNPGPGLDLRKPESAHPSPWIGPPNAWTCMRSAPPPHGGFEVSRRAAGPE